MGPNPVRLHPSPEAAQHHAQLLALAPLAAPLWPADESLVMCGEQCWSNDAIPSARGWPALREIHDAVFAAAGLEVMAEEATEDVRDAVPQASPSHKN